MPALFISKFSFDTDHLIQNFFKLRDLTTEQYAYASVGFCSEPWICKAQQWLSLGGTARSFLVPHGFGLLAKFGIRSSNLRLEMDCSTSLEFSKTWVNVSNAYLPLSPCFNTEMWSAHPLLPLARLDVYKWTLKLLVLDLKPLRMAVKEPLTRWLFFVYFSFLKEKDQIRDCSSCFFGCQKSLPFAIILFVHWELSIHHRAQPSFTPVLYGNAIF